MSHGQVVTFTLYSNPVFVHVPRCSGTNHPIHERMANKHMRNVVLARDLGSRIGLDPLVEPLMIIDATESGEEVMARAWCAEKGKHAVIRRAGVGCFTCATNLAATRTGLGFAVLIWCN
jgi:hypothetical protein